jgi:hypothetical protein
MAFAVQCFEPIGTQMRHQQATRQFIGPNVEDQRSGAVRCHLAIKTEHFQSLIAQRVLRLGRHTTWHASDFGPQRCDIVLNGLQALKAVLGLAASNCSMRSKRSGVVQSPPTKCA